MKRRAFLSATAAGLAVAASPFAARSGTAGMNERVASGSRRGLAARLTGRDPAVYRARLQAELDVISRLGLSRHFVFAHELVAAARQRGIPVFAGLCAASASLVCWALGLSEIDPVEHDLPFETFINWRRPSPPYFDVAVCARRQPELLHLLGERWGADRVAFASCDADPSRWVLWAIVTKSGAEESVGQLIEERPHRDTSLSLKQLLAADSELRHAIEADPELRRVVGIALELSRNMATSCGSDSVPGSTLVASPEGPLAGVERKALRDRQQPVCILDRGSAESLGLLTVSCPPLPALSALAFAQEPVGEPGPQVWDMIAAGDTEGVVGLESHLHDFLRRSKPRTLAELAAVFAVFRPAPIESGMADLFAEGGPGRSAPEPVHPLVEKATVGTRGVLVFKEQLMRVTHALTGFDLASADLMRRSLGKRRPDEIEYWRARFTEAAVRRGVDRASARRLFENLEMFAAYLTGEAYDLALATLSLRMASFKLRAPREYARALREVHGE